MINPNIETSVDKGTPPKKTYIWRAGTLVYTTSGLLSLFAWLSLGDFAWSMRDRSVLPMAQWYLNSLKVPNLLFGLIISSFPAFVGLILGPTISVWSDRHRSKRGRRIPFLLVTGPLAALGMVGLGVTPLVTKWVHGYLQGQTELVVSLICFGLFWAAFEFATIASQAVFGGLINDVVPTPLLGRFYGLFRAVSLIAGMMFNWWIMGRVPNHFTRILLAIGLFYGVSFFLVCLRVKEGAYPPPPLSDSASTNVAERFLREVGRYWRECFTNSYYNAVFVLMMAAGLSFFPVNTFTIPFANSLGVNMHEYGKSVTITFGISFGLSYFLGWLVDVFHPIRMIIAVLILYLGVSLWAFFCATTPETFLVAWVLHGVLSGCYFTCSASLGQRLFPKARYAQFASAGGIVFALAVMVMAPITGVIIDRSIYRLTFAIGAIFTVLALGAAWFVYVKFKKMGGTAAYQPPEETT
ncbi:MAG: MFS transporter [Chthoniobacteraceae bacterium]